MLKRPVEMHRGENPKPLQERSQTNTCQIEKQTLQSIFQ